MPGMMSGGIAKTKDIEKFVAGGYAPAATAPDSQASNPVDGSKNARLAEFQETATSVPHVLSYGAALARLQMQDTAVQNAVVTRDALKPR